MSALSARTMEEAEQVRVAAARASTPLAASERQAEAIVGAAFALAALVLALAVPGRGGGSPAALACCVLMLAGASRVQFAVGVGFTVPTQLAFVPLLAVAPPALLAPATAFGLALGLAPEILTGRLRAARLLMVPGNGWFAIGPAVVLALAGGRSGPVPVAALVAAMPAQLATDFAANLVRELVQRRSEAAELVREVRWVYLVDLALFPVGLAVALTAEVRWWAVLLMAPLLALLAVFSRERQARLEQLGELNDAYRGTALVLGDVVEADDAYTGAHTWGVVRLSLAVAAELGLDAARRRNVEFGALLHDVGKVAIPNAIINKPGPLDPDEWTVMKTHTVEGQRMLDRVGGLMRDVGFIVRCSHERWDGGGYPDGLAGAAIPLEARIVACCDAYNAMTTTRSYRNAMDEAAALAELRRGAATQFDPDVVEALLRVLARDRGELSPAPAG